MRHMSWVVAALVVVGACARKEDDVVAVGKVRDAFTAAWKTGNAAQLAELYDENATVAQNHQPTLEGRIAIASSWGGQFAQMTPNDIVITSQRTEVHGDLAYDYGTFQYTVTPKTGGAPVSDNGRYIVVLKRAGDTWKIVADVDNSAAPLPQQPQTATQPATQAPPQSTTTSQ